MIYISKFESFNNDIVDNGRSLIIVDVQKSFKKFFTELYLTELKTLCKSFDSVYQIFDNHIDGKNVSKDYLYDEEHSIDIHNDLYEFPKQVDIIEKRYNYDVNVDFYKNILEDSIYNDIKYKEVEGKLKKGDIFTTKSNTIIVYIGNNHKWFHVPLKLYNLLKDNKGKVVSIVGGSDLECLEDVYVTAESLGVKIKRLHRYIYSATNCPI